MEDDKKQKPANEAEDQENETESGDDQTPGSPNAPSRSGDVIIIK
ncbi:MAG TPA: hypothetical protein VGN90_14050 [Pyrinomonadaceae bacterium]|jgi:hypothetical protein|nr:hypothetical protein [Pyrinomonadaceae bacterium]